MKLIAFLQAEYPEALPRHRAEVAGTPQGKEDVMAKREIVADATTAS